MISLLGKNCFGKGLVIKTQMGGIFEEQMVKIGRGHEVVSIL